MMKRKMFSLVVLGSFLFLTVSCGGGDKAAEAPQPMSPPRRRQRVLPPICQRPEVSPAK